MPDGTEKPPADTVGSVDKRTLVSEAWRTLDMREGLDHAVRTPCVRRSLLFGMTGAFAIGGLRWVFSRNILSGLNWALGPGCLLALGAHTKCTNDIARQRQRIAQAIELNKERARQRAEGVPQPKLPKGVLGAEPSGAMPPSPSAPRGEPTGRLI